MNFLIVSILISAFVIISQAFPRYVALNRTDVYSSGAKLINQVVNLLIADSHVYTLIQVRLLISVESFHTLLSIRPTSSLPNLRYGSALIIRLVGIAIKRKCLRLVLTIKGLRSYETDASHQI